MFHNEPCISIENQTCSRPSTTIFLRQLSTKWSMDESVNIFTTHCSSYFTLQLSVAIQHNRLPHPARQDTQDTVNLAHCPVLAKPHVIDVHLRRDRRQSGPRPPGCWPSHVLSGLGTWEVREDGGSDGGVKMLCKIFPRWFICVQMLTLNLHDGNLSQGDDCKLTIC